MMIVLQHSPLLIYLWLFGIYFSCIVFLFLRNLDYYDFLEDNFFGKLFSRIVWLIQAISLFLIYAVTDYLYIEYTFSICLLLSFIVMLFGYNFFYIGMLLAKIPFFDWGNDF